MADGTPALLPKRQILARVRPLCVLIMLTELLRPTKVPLFFFVCEPEILAGLGIDDRSKDVNSDS
jgi:hypothetical protein